MSRKTFTNLLGKGSKASMPRKADEEVLSPVEETTTPEVSLNSNDVVIPEGSTQLECEVYITPEGDLTLVPAEPLEIESLDEPVTQLDIEIHSEEEPIETPEPVELESVPTEEKPVEEAALTAEQACDSMRSLNDPSCAVALVKAGTEANPSWIVLKNGSIFATIAYADQPPANDYKAFFANASFSDRVAEAAKTLGWHEVLPKMFAKLITPKVVVAAPVSVDLKAIKADLRQELHNDMQLAYKAMIRRMRNNPLAAKLYDAAAAAQIPAPEVFVAGVIEDPQGSFISSLFETTVELNSMSKEIKKEFRALVEKTEFNVPKTSSYQPDLSFQARLTANSISVAPVSTETSMPSQGSFSGLFN